MITVACVKTGKKYSPADVYRLRRAVGRHLELPHRFICITDRPEDFPNLETVRVGPELPIWWAKMRLFNPDWRTERNVYFDLDTLLVGDLKELATLAVRFAICENFTKLAGNDKWPCAFGSCVMLFDKEWGKNVWNRFLVNKNKYIDESRSWGDQYLIQRLVPTAPLLQKLLPTNYFVGYRDLSKYPKGPPKNCSIVVYAGKRTPLNFGPSWCKEEWLK